MSKCKKYPAYLVTAVAGAVIMTVVIAYEIGQLGSSQESVIRSISDGSFVAGVMIGGLGLMTAIANAGNFHGIRYLGKVAVAKLRRNRQDTELAKNYYEYVKAAEKEKREVKFFLVVGGIYLLVAVVFTMIFQTTIC